jgi:hypothetical protein
MVIFLPIDPSPDCSLIMTQRIETVCGFCHMGKYI